MRRDIMIIQPDKAMALLNLACKHGFENRNISWPHVEKLARSIQSGSWQCNGEPIRLDTEFGFPYDGHHRLLACIRAQTPIKTAVWYGSVAEMPTLDCGLSRRVGDYLKFAGHTNTALLAATILFIYKYYSGMPLTAGIRLSAEEVQQFIAAYPDIEQYVSESHVYRELLGAKAAAMMRFLIIDKDKATRFCDNVEKGDMISITSPAYRLRERLLTIRQAKYGRSMRRVTEPEKIALVFKAWNAQEQGRKITKLGWKTQEPFPVLEGQISIKQSAFPKKVDRVKTYLNAPKTLVKVIEKTALDLTSRRNISVELKSQSN